MRAINLANALVRHGHEVVLWSSAFYHTEKKHRSRQFTSLRVSDRLTVNLIPSPGYSRNIGVGRLWDHAAMAIHLRSLLAKDEFPLPDVAFVGFPPIETSLVMLTWLSKRGVPSVIDVKDQWPSLFLEKVPGGLKPLATLVLAPYFSMAKRSMQKATAFCSMSRSYLDWMARFSGRPLSAKDMVVPLSTPRLTMTEDQIRDARDWWQKRGVDLRSKRRFFFVGTFMSVFDFTGIRDAARRFNSEGIDCQFVLCGEGGNASEIREVMSGLPNVVFPGWVEAPQVVALAASVSGCLVPYKNIENFTLNLPNKVIDAFALGVPILTALEGELRALIDDKRIGLFCEGGGGDQYFQAMKFVLDHPEEQREMADRCLALYDAHFSCEKVYDQLVSSLKQLAKR